MEYGDGGELVPCDAPVTVFGVPITPTGSSGGGGLAQPPKGDSTATQPEPPVSPLYVTTHEASDVTFTTAKLHGEANNSSLPTTGYFRYSKSEISPVYCNDIYGSNMHATGDIILGKKHDTDILLWNGMKITKGKSNDLKEGINSFSYTVIDLTPDTTYYYCAIISDKTGILYGGKEIVKNFHTSPLNTKITTNTASEITTSKAVLNATLSSLFDTTTYFQSRVILSAGSYSAWEDINGSRVKHLREAGKNNIYKKIDFPFDGLSSDTTYQFRGVAEIDSKDTPSINGTPIPDRGSQNKTVYGKPATFRTGKIQETIVRTNGASAIRETSARLNGSYISIKSIEINFEYREYIKDSDDVSNPWRNVGTQSYSNTTRKAESKSVYKDLSGLKKDTKYQFRVYGDTYTGSQSLYYGAIFDFTTGDPNRRIIDDGNGNGGGGSTTPPITTCTAPLVYNLATRSCVDPAPDLRAEAIYPNIAYDGVAQTYSATISNIGPLEAKNTSGDSFIEHLFQWDNDIDHTAVSGMSFERTDGPIGSNKTTSVSKSIIFTGVGTTKYIRVCADSNDLFVNRVYELNENNNCGPWSAIQVSVIPPTCSSTQILNRSRDTCIDSPRSCTAPQIYNFTTNSCTDPKPDLISSIVLPAVAYDGVSQIYSATISNMGPTEARDANGDGSIEHLIQWDNDTDHNSVNSFDFEKTYGTILPDGKAIVSKPYILTGVGTTKYVRVCADSNDLFVNTVVSELDENNNCGPWNKIEVREKPSIIDSGVFPTLKITATPTSVNPGGSSVISWISTNTTSCDAKMGTNNKGTSGSFNTGPLTKSKSFQVLCTGDKGEIGAYTYVSVNTSNNGNDTLPTLLVLANPSSVSSGGSSVISWTSTNTTSCNAGVGNGTGVSGSFNTGPLTKGKSFAISCTGNSGDVSFYTYVRVVSDNICIETETNDCSGDGNNDNDDKDGIWDTSDGGASGTWGTGNSSGTWEATQGKGGSGPADWSSNGDGTGTWRGPDSSGTWKTSFGNPSGNNGGWNQKKLGDIATPPWDAIVRYHEGIETVFARQIVNRKILQDAYGYDGLSSLQNFAWTLSDVLAKRFGYINPTRKEVRVIHPDRAAYELQVLGNRLIVYEYFDYRIIDVRNITTEFKDIANYEYYYQKR